MFDFEIGLVPSNFFAEAHFLDPGFARAPAKILDEICGRANDIRNVLHKIAAAIVVVIDGVVEIMPGQELRLAKFTCPRADHLILAQIAFFDDHHRGFEFFAKEFPAPAIPSKSQQRTHDRQITHADAEVAFESPESRDDSAWHAKFFFGAREYCGVLLQIRAPRLIAILRRELAVELKERLIEEALLAITANDALIRRHTADGSFNGLRLDAVRYGFLFEVDDPAREGHVVLTIARLRWWRHGGLGPSGDETRRQEKCGKGQAEK